MKNKVRLIALTLGLASTSWAQVAQLPNTVPLGAEGITVTACSAACTLQIGVGSTWSAPIVPGAALPLTLQYGTSSVPAILGSDPAPNILKAVVAQEQAAAYTVTLSDGTVKTIPPLPIKITLSAVQIPEGQESKGQIGIYDLPVSLAYNGYDGTRLVVTIGSASYVCDYVSLDGGTFTLSCTPQPPAAAPGS